MKIERSICGKYIRVTLSNGQTEIIDVGDWSKIISRSGEFVYQPLLPVR